MKPIKLLTIVVALSFGVMAAMWTSLALWYDMKEGLIAFLGLLAAALVQVMPITANFLQSDRLTPAEAERLTASLTNQQRYWMGLLTATIITMVFVIIGAALKERVVNLPPVFWVIHWSEIACFFIASSVSFVLMKLLGMLQGIMSLHRLRGELVINAAKREAAERSATIQKQAEIKKPIVGDDYGQLVQPTHH